MFDVPQLRENPEEGVRERPEQGIRQRHNPGLRGGGAACGAGGVPMMVGCWWG